MQRQLRVGERFRYSPPWPSEIDGDTGTITAIYTAGYATAQVEWDNGSSSMVLIDCLRAILAEATIVGNELRLDDINTS